LEFGELNNSIQNLVRCELVNTKKPQPQPQTQPHSTCPTTT